MKFFTVLMMIMVLTLAGCTQATNKEQDPEQNNDEVLEENESNETEEAEDTSTSEENKPSEADETNEENGKEENTDEVNEQDSELTGEPNAHLTDEEAIQKVKEYLNITTDEDVHVVVDREEGGKYIIQVFDVVAGEGGVGHTATRGWYLVDIETGEVESMF